MPKPAYLQKDNLDDRRESLKLLHRLPPWIRVRFVAVCCQCSAISGSDWRPRVASSTLELAEHARTADDADDRLTQELWRDIWYLAAQYDLNLDLAFKCLEQVAKAYAAGRQHDLDDALRRLEQVAKAYAAGRLR